MNSNQGILIASNIVILIIVAILISFITRVTVKESFDNVSYATIPMNDLEYEPRKHGKIPTLLDNKCHPNCCSQNNTYTCSTGCICLTEQDKKLLDRK